MATVKEIEDKYEVDAAFVMPFPHEAAGSTSTAEARTDELEAVYYDTEDYRLARNKITLRRRTGGVDAGWHLKLPAEVGRTEIQRPLGQARRVPPELSQLVFARTRGLPLAPVARLKTTRTTYPVLGNEEAVLAEVADDIVTAQVLETDGHAVEISAWREVEVELMTGGPAVLKTVGKQLRTAGARPSARPSKLAGVLGDRLSAGPDVPTLEVKTNKRTSAGEVIRGYLSNQLQAMLAADIQVRLDEPESVHDMRVAIRRIRSTLGSYRRLLNDQSRARELEERLRVLAAELGAVRDNEVLLERLLAEVADQPSELILGPVDKRLREDLLGAKLKGRDAVLKTMRGPDYAELVDELITLIATGLTSGGLAQEPAAQVLPKLIRRRNKKLIARVEHALALTSQEQEIALHQARKAAKKARYAAEAAVPIFGTKAKSLASACEQVQEMLGEHQDAVVATDALRRLAITTRTHSDESAFTFGLLAGVERARAEAARSQFTHYWKKASKQHP